jgi:drug/metabolite transporter (DMT)-like permease
MFHWHPRWVGFIPILYSTLSARWRKSSLRLPDESPDDTLDSISESQKVPQEKLTGRRILLLWLPAICDLTGTTVRTFTLSSPIRAPSQSLMYMCDWVLQLMNVGLLYTPVSIYQMTRGALVLFVGILSVFFLHRRLFFYQ